MAADKADKKVKGAAEEAAPEADESKTEELEAEILDSEEEPAQADADEQAGDHGPGPAAHAQQAGDEWRRDEHEYVLDVHHASSGLHAHARIAAYDTVSA